MTEAEFFVNPSLATEHGTNLVRLLGLSNASKVDAWFEALAIVDQVGPESNVGVRGLSWRLHPVAKTGEYKVRAICVDGPLDTTIGGPGTLEEARSEEWLTRVRTTYEQLTAKRGGLQIARQRQPANMGKALVAALCSSEEGAEWAANRKHPEKVLMAMARVAGVYGREGVFLEASLGAHQAFIPFDDRADLVRQFPRAIDAWRKASTLGHGGEYGASARTVFKVSASRVATLAIRTGVNRAEARVILRAMLDGRSKSKLIRAVNQAAEMVSEMEAREDHRAAS